MSQSAHGASRPSRFQPPDPAYSYALTMDRHAATDHSWTIFGAAMVVGLVLSAAYCACRAFSTHEKEPEAVVEVGPPSFFSPVSMAQSANTQVLPPLPGTGQLLSWHDLSLMLRTGLSDGEIIDIIKGRQASVPVTGPTQETSLRELGAGDQLLNFLRTRPSYVPAAGAGHIVTAAPPVRPVAAVVPSMPVPAPVDYAAKDRRIRDLQTQIDALDQQILYARGHPESYLYLGPYNGGGIRYGEESPLKKYLDGLDKQRNDLRREKWRLEGR